METKRMVNAAKSLSGRGEPLKGKSEIAELPHYCDFTCPHASFAPNDVVGACRRELAVYCHVLARFTNKNARCGARRRSFS